MREVVEPCLKHSIGMVQMPCPEQLAWGGVLKQWLLKAYGIRGTLLYRCRAGFPLSQQWIARAAAPWLFQLPEPSNDALICSP